MTACGFSLDSRFWAGLPRRLLAGLPRRLLAGYALSVCNIREL